MSSTYSYTDDSTFTEFIADENITSTFDTSSREAMISQGERYVNSYVGTSFTGTVPDVIISATLEYALYNAKLRMADDIGEVNSDPTYGVEESRATQNGNYTFQAMEHKRNADFLIKNYGAGLHRYAKAND